MVQQNKKVKNNTWFILDSNGLAVQFQIAGLIRMGLLTVPHGLGFTQEAYRKDVEAGQSTDSEADDIDSTHFLISCYNILSHF